MGGKTPQLGEERAFVVRRLWKGYSWFDIARDYDPLLDDTFLYRVLSDIYFGSGDVAVTAEEVAYFEVRAMGPPWDEASVETIEETFALLDGWGFSWGCGIRYVLGEVEEALEVLADRGYLERLPDDAPLYRLTRPVDRTNRIAA